MTETTCTRTVATVRVTCRSSDSNPAHTGCTLARDRPQHSRTFLNTENVQKCHLMLRSMCKNVHKCQRRFWRQTQGMSRPSRTPLTQTFANICKHCSKMFTNVHNGPRAKMCSFLRSTFRNICEHLTVCLQMSQVVPLDESRGVPIVTNKNIYEHLTPPCSDLRR